jgi:hypothetical protein
MWYGIGNTVIANPSTMRGALRWSAGSGAHLMLYNGAQEIGQGPQRSCRRCSPTRWVWSSRASSR